MPPPRLYDLTTLQREANKLLGLTASKTLEIVQGLYEKKIVTYPRTDSKFITEDMAYGIDNLVVMYNHILTKATGNETFAKSFTSNVGQIVNNSKVTDHHAIIPTMSVGGADLKALGADERNILLMICTKLICAVGDKHTYAETVVTVDCAEEVFTAKGKTVINNGWKQVEDDFHKSLGRSKKDGDGAALPTHINEGQKFTSKSAVREGFTSPPKHYTEDTLLSAMENARVEGVTEDIERKGLGTPATRASILENLVKNEFLRRDKKNLLPTDKGVNLIKVLPDKVKSPLLTAEWENNLKRMERGEVTAVGFMQSINDFIKDVVRTFRNTSAENANPFGTVGVDGEIIGLCPRCGGNVAETPKAFSCERTRSKACAFILWKENRFFVSQGKKITKGIATQLVNNGRVFIPDLKSQKTNKKYGATILLDDNNEGFVGFKMEFNSAK